MVDLQRHVWEVVNQSTNSRMASIAAIGVRLMICHKCLLLSMNIWGCAVLDKRCGNVLNSFFSHEIPVSLVHIFTPIAVTFPSGQLIQRIAMSGLGELVQ